MYLARAFKLKTKTLEKESVSAPSFFTPHIYVYILVSISF